MKKIFILIISLVFALNAESQIHYTVSFYASDLNIDTITAIDGNTYSMLKIAKLHNIVDTGKPELPVKYVQLYVPSGKDVDNISITNSSFSTYNLDSRVFPTQNPVPISLTTTVDGFIFSDSAVYNSTSAWPSEMVKIVDNGFFDGNNRILTLTITPFQYYPLLSRLDFYTSVSITVTLKQSTGNPVDSVKYRTPNMQKIYTNLLKNMVDNPQDVPAYSPPNTTTKAMTLPSYEYVIITDHSLASGFEDFVAWKRRKGINIGIVETNDIYTCSDYSTGDIISTPAIIDNAGKVRQYLYDAHFNGNPSTTWALIAGDYNTNVPTRLSALNNIPTDSYFADLSGDWSGNEPLNAPDIFIGRLICSNTTDIQNWTNKVLLYEQNPGNGDYSYLLKAFSIEADQMQGFTPQGFIHDQAVYVSACWPSFSTDIMREWPEPFACYDNNGIVTSGSSMGQTGITKGSDAIAQWKSTHYGLISWFCHGGTGGQNSGILTMGSGIHNYCIYYGHCSDDLDCENQWKLDAQDAYTFNNVIPEANNGLDNLNHADYPSILYSISCDVTPFDITSNTLNNGGARNCGEAFTALPQTGGVAFLGNTRAGYVESSYLLYENFIDLIISNDYHSHLGIAESFSKYTYGNKYLAYSHNLVGCPEIQMWTAIPQEFSVNYDPHVIIVNTSNNIVVNIDNLDYLKDAVVCLWKENDGIFEVETVTGDINTHASCTFSSIIAPTFGDIYLTVTSHNYIPYQATILVVDDCNYNSTTNNISIDQTWSGFQYSNCDININPNVKLTLTGTLLMNPNSKITIQPGGLLEVNGGKITNGCGDLWRGIEVWGNSTQHQYTYYGNCYQGKVILQNGAVIENAAEGIMNWKDGDWNSIGGIIQANDAYFINNHRAVLMVPYSNFNPNNPSELRNDLSYFKKCHFETNNNLPNSEFFSFITLWKVKGISIKGCTFENLNPNAATSSELGMGIYSIDANFEVDNSCSNDSVSPCPANNIIISRFNHLHYGIKTLKAETNNTYSVLNAEIKNCAFGIFNSGVDNAIANYNKILYETPYPLSPSTVAGIYFNGGTAYTVEENEFVSSLSNITTTAVYILNTGTEQNKIYKNTVTGFNYGLKAIGNNRNGTGSSGLQFLCNTFSGGINADIHTLNDPVIRKPNGIRTNQGESNSLFNLISAGNIFSNIAPNGMNIRNDASWAITYFYGSGQNEYPSIVTSNVTRLSSTTNNTCPSNNGGGGGTLSFTSISELENNFNAEDNIVNNLKNQLSTLIDGGNTENMLSEIENSWPDETWKIYNDLQRKSPFLSEQVLFEASYKTDVLPNAVLFDIFKSNPNGYNNDDLLNYLSEKNNPLSGWMIDTLNIARKKTTYRSVLEGQLAFHSAKREQNAYDIIKIILSDTNGINHNLLQTWLARSNNYLSDVMSVNDYCQKNDFQSAQSIVDDMPSKFKLNDEEIIIHQTYDDLFTHLRTFHDNAKTIYQLDSLDVLKVKELADYGYGIGKIYARNICEIYGYFYEPEIAEEGIFNLVKSMQTGDISGSSVGNEPEYLKVFPVPANEWLVVKWDLPAVNYNTSIILTNAQGINQTIISPDASSGEKIIDTRNWNSGIYYYKVLQTNKTIQTGKIIISK